MRIVNLWGPLTCLTLLAVLLSVGTAAGAPTTASNTGVVVRLLGAVRQFQEGSAGPPETLRPFMEVHKGSRIVLGPGAVVQLLYPSALRSETWQGPGTFIAGASAGIPAERDAPAAAPVTAAVPPVAAREIQRLARLVEPAPRHPRGERPSRSRPPAKAVELNPAEKEEIRKAREVYASLASRAEAGDIMPELYLFSILADFDQFSEMARLIEKMRRKQPHNAGIDRLAQWLADHRNR